MQKIVFSIRAHEKYKMFKNEVKLEINSFLDRFAFQRIIKPLCRNEDIFYAALQDVVLILFINKRKIAVIDIRTKSEFGSIKAAFEFLEAN